MRDAVRPFDIFVFKVEIYYDEGQEPSTHYFINRLELGYTGSGKSTSNASVYDKLKAAGKILNHNNGATLRSASGHYVDGIDDIAQELGLANASNDDRKKQSSKNKGKEGQPE